MTGYCHLTKRVEHHLATGCLYTRECSKCTSATGRRGRGRSVAGLRMNHHYRFKNAYVVCKLASLSCFLLFSPHAFAAERKTGLSLPSWVIEGGVFNRTSGDPEGCKTMTGKRQNETGTETVSLSLFARLSCEESDSFSPSPCRVATYLAFSRLFSSSNPYVRSSTSSGRVPLAFFRRTEESFSCFCSTRTPRRGNALTQYAERAAGAQKEKRNR